ncbi:MAG: TIGR00730 family Rossman fold protein [Acidimicrobiales bacterium]
MANEPTPPATAAQVEQLLDAAGVTDDRDLVRRIVVAALGMAADHDERLDLKITTAAVEEMRSAYRMFAPFRDHPKVTVFGSARTTSVDPLYAQAHDLAEAMAAAGWMVVTGAGPGIMQAATEGAGRDAALGVSIRLPFEPRPNDGLDEATRLVSMKYFFTRKLMLVKESRGFVSMPGGFGTLDETLELLTLQQTGKAEPVPIVLLDVPGGSYWHGFERFVRDHLVTRGLVADDDMARVLVTDSVPAAVAELTGFYRNYHSLRWVGTRLVLRLRATPTDAEVADLDERFAGLVRSGHVERIEATPPEVADGDHVELPRIALDLEPGKVGELHRLIRAANALASAPPA